MEGLSPGLHNIIFNYHQDASTVGRASIWDIAVNGSADETAGSISSIKLLFEFLSLLDRPKCPVQQEVPVQTQDLQYALCVLLGHFQAPLALQNALLAKVRHFNNNTL